MMTDQISLKFDNKDLAVLTPEDLGTGLYVCRSYSRVYLVRCLQPEKGRPLHVLEYADGSTVAGARDCVAIWNKTSWMLSDRDFEEDFDLLKGSYFIYGPISDL